MLLLEISYGCHRKKPSVLHWNRVTTPKDKGGLGIKVYRDMNMVNMLNV